METSLKYNLENNPKNIIIIVLLLFIFMLMCSCRTCLSVDTDIKETIKIDTIHNYKLITLNVPIPFENVKTIVPDDSISFIETNIAYSMAKLLDGKLYHSLTNKDTVIRYDTIYTENIIYRDRNVVKTEVKNNNKKYTYLMIIILSMLFIMLLIKSK